MQDESSQDELPQFTPAGMRRQTDDIRLLERVKQATAKENISHQNQSRRKTNSNNNNNQEVIP